MSAKVMRIKEKRALDIIEEIKISLLRWEEFTNKVMLDRKTIETVEKMFILYD